VIDVSGVRSSCEIVLSDSASSGLPAKISSEVGSSETCRRAGIRDSYSSYSKETGRPTSG